MAVDGYDDYSKILVQLGVLTTQMSQVMEDIRDLKTSIKGNGKAGMEKRLDLLEQRIQNPESYCPMVEKVNEMQLYIRDIEARQKQIEQSLTREAEEKREQTKYRMDLNRSLILLLLGALVNFVVGIINTFVR